jgi:hypothetical protein
MAIIERMKCRKDEVAKKSTSGKRYFWFVVKLDLKPRGGTRRTPVNGLSLQFYAQMADRDTRQRQKGKERIEASYWVEAEREKETKKRNRKWREPILLSESIQESNGKHKESEEEKRKSNTKQKKQKCGKDGEHAAVEKLLFLYPNLGRFAERELRCLLRFLRLNFTQA